MKYESIVDLTKQLLKSDFPKEKLKKLLNFLKLYVHFDQEELNTTFGRQFELLTTKNKFMGINELILHFEKEKGLDINLIRDITSLPLKQLTGFDRLRKVCKEEIPQLQKQN